MKKLFSLILVLLCASVIICGCGKKEQQNTDKTNNSNTEKNGIEITDSEKNGIEITDTEKNGIEITDTEANAYHTDIEARIETVVSKTDLDNEVLASVNGVPVSAAAIKYAVFACNDFYAYSTEENVEELKTNEILNFYRLNAAVVIMAKDQGIEISEEDFKAGFTDIYEMYKQMYGEDEVDSVIEMYTYQTPFFYFLNQYYNTLYSRLNEKFLENEENAAKIREATLNDMLESETPYVRAKHILICFPESTDENGEVTQQQKDETLAKANDVLARLSNGEDFDALVAEVGEDPGMQTYPGGYYFTTGMMVAPFEETAFALEEGEISDPVETDYGYHIILKLPLDDDAITATDEYINKSYEFFSEELNVVADSYEISFSENYDARFADFETEYNTPAEEVTQEDAE